MLSHEAQCDGIVAVDAMLYFVMLTLFGNVEYSYSSFFNIIEAFIKGYCLMSGYIFECI